MANWIDGTVMADTWGAFKSKLASSLTSLSNAVSQNTSDISDRVTKKQLELANAFKYKSSNLIQDTSTDKFKYLYENYATSSSQSNQRNYRKTITRTGEIFEYDCVNKLVVKINPINGNITKYSMVVQNSNISYMWYIGTYADGGHTYSYLWGIVSDKGYGIFKVEHGDETYANSVSSVFIRDIAQDLKYYISGTSTISTYSTSYLYTKLSVLVSNEVCIIVNSNTGNANYQERFDIAFSWDGTKLRKLNINSSTNYYNGYRYHYECGTNFVTDRARTYTDSYKITLNTVSYSSVTLKIEAVVPKFVPDACCTIIPVGFYNEYVVFCNNITDSNESLILLPINDNSYYEIIPFKRPYTSSVPYYNRLMFINISSGDYIGNYMFLPVFNGADGLHNVGVVHKRLDEC